MLACFGGHLETAKELHMRFGASLEKKNDYLCSCAHWAAMGGHVHVLEWLFERGVPMDEAQIECQLPSHKSAAKRKWPALLWLLDKYQHDPRLVEYKDACGFTALELASSQGCPQELLKDIHL